MPETHSTPAVDPRLTRGLVPYCDEDGNVYERPPRAGIWMGGVDQIKHAAAGGEFAAYTGDLTGVYRVWECSGMIIYVGITNDPVRRWNQHAATKFWWPSADVIGLIPFGSLRIARLVERQVIRDERPIYNVHHSRRPFRG